MIVTFVVDGYDVHPLESVIMVHRYDPVAAVLAFGIVGFRRVLLKPFGPVHV